jgi:hypothetical protein
MSKNKGGAQTNPIIKKVEIKSIDFSIL